jgi:hypothetical protein
MKTKRILGIVGCLVVMVFALTLVAYSQEGQLQDISKLKLPPKLLEMVNHKPPVSEGAKRLHSFENGKFLFMALPGRKFILIPPDKMEFTPPPDRLERSFQVDPSILKYQAYYKILRNVKLVPICGTVVDHRSRQTPIKDQADRGTCVAHAAMAGLEVAYGSTTLNLNENYAYYKFLGSSQSAVCADGGLRTVDAADLMVANKMCEESYWPYVNTLSGLGCPHPGTWPTAVCASNAKYGVTTHKEIWRKDDLASDEGEYINNPKYLESVLCSGRDIVTGFNVAGWPSGQHGIIDVVSGASIIGGHAMVIVGYNRNGDASIGGGYFIVKNSWGTGSGQSGYLYLSYDYIRVYSKYGFYITGTVPTVFKVTAVSATASPTAYSGKCPGLITFTGHITANMPGTVKYTWLRSDGATSPTETLDFANAGTKTVTRTWQLGGTGLTSYAGWEQVKVISPNAMLSGKANFTLKCTP